jgi:hypothetical protein
MAQEIGSSANPVKFYKSFILKGHKTWKSVIFTVEFTKALHRYKAPHLALPKFSVSFEKSSKVPWIEDLQ